MSSLDVQEGGDHYKNMAIQPVEFIAANKIQFLDGCVIKRVCRHRAKNGAEDIRKAIHDLFVSFPDQDQFTKEDMKEMKRGRAAYAKESQVVWKRNKMEFHHQWIKQRELKWSIAHKLATLIGMSPRFHDDGNHMDDEEHYGKNRWTKKALQREERATKYRTQN